VEIYEEDGEKVPIGKSPYMLVESHWNHNEQVILKIGKKSITVIARDLETAIENATNTNWP